MRDLILAVGAVMLGYAVSTACYSPMLDELNKENSALYERLLIQRDDVNKALAGLKELEERQKQCGEIMSHLGLLPSF